MKIKGTSCELIKEKDTASVNKVYTDLSAGVLNLVDKYGSDIFKDIDKIVVTERDEASIFVVENTKNTITVLADAIIRFKTSVTFAVAHELLHRKAKKDNK